MALTPEQFLQKLQATKEAIVIELPYLAQKVVSNAKALAEKNILEKGFGERYSQQEIPTYFFKGKELNAGGTRYLEQHGVNTGRGGTRRRRRNQPVDTTGTWAEFRQAQGRQSAFVDLSYSGRLWAGLVPLQPQVNNYLASCMLGATNTEVQKEISYNYLRFGDFIRKGLGENDFRLIEQAAIDDIMQIIQDKLL